MAHRGHHHGHHRYHHGHGGFRQGAFLRWHRPRQPDPYAPFGADADDDGDDGPPPPFPFPPFPPGSAEMEAERYGRGRRRRYDDQEVSLNDERPMSRSKETNGVRRSGRWILSKGKLILIGV